MSCTAEQIMRMGFIPNDDPATPPYGKPDNVETYNSSSYQSVTYIYNCLNGQYVKVTYSRGRLTYVWNMWTSSTFRTTGICK